MTMIDNHAAPWHTTADGRDAEIADLRRRLADAEHRAMRSAQREDFEQFSFENAKRRGDRAEAALRALLTEYVIAPHVPADAVDELVGSLVDDIGAGAELSELDLTGIALIQYGPDGFTPEGVEVPF